MVEDIMRRLTLDRNSVATVAAEEFSPTLLAFPTGSKSAFPPQIEPRCDKKQGSDEGILLNQGASGRFCAAADWPDHKSSEIALSGFSAVY
jgi:hypothetical protein